MELTSENKDYIDSLSYEALLARWRFAAVGDKWFQGETGRYWRERMEEVCRQPGGWERHVATSKFLGWEKE